MTAFTSPPAIQLRLAGHYADKLRRASAAFRRGPGNRAHWLHVIQQDWDQIKAQQAWAAARRDHDPACARLCAAFAVSTAEILRVRLTPAEQLAWAEQALAAARQTGDVQAELKLLYQASFLGLTLEKPDLSEDYAAQLTERAAAARSRLGLGRARFIQGAVAFIRGEYDLAERRIRACMKQLEAVRALDELGQAWLTLGRIANVRGAYREARSCYLEYLNTSLTNGNQQAELEARMQLSGIHLALGEHAVAEAYGREVVMMARAFGTSRFLPPALNSLAHAEKAQGRLDDAARHYDEALRAARGVSSPSTIANTLHGLGQVRAVQGDHAAALACFDEALAVARDAHYLLRACEVAHDLVFLHVAAGQFALARARLAEAVDDALTLATPYFLAKVLGSAIVLWLHAGEPEQAAVWAGLLRDHLDLLPPSLFDVGVYAQLESALGPARCREALERGRTLSLPGVVEDIRRQLRAVV